MGLTYYAQATDARSGNKVAIKVEHIRTEPSVLRSEAEIYKLLAYGTGIVRVHLFPNECVTTV